MVGLDVAEGVTGDSAYRDAVDQDVTDMVTAIGGDGEGLVGALVDGNCPAGVDGTACAGTGRNSIGHYRNLGEGGGNTPVVCHNDRGRVDAPG